MYVMNEGEFVENKHIYLITLISSAMLEADADYACWVEVYFIVTS